MDYMYPSVFLAYFLFFVLTMLTLVWLLLTYKAGYFGDRAEDPKYRMMHDDEEGDSYGR